MRPRKKNFTSWNNWNIELSNDTLIVKIEQKLFPQLIIPLLHSFFLDTLYTVHIIYIRSGYKTPNDKKRPIQQKAQLQNVQCHKKLTFYVEKRQECSIFFHENSQLFCLSSSKSVFWGLALWLVVQIHFI